MKISNTSKEITVLNPADQQKFDFGNAALELLTERLIGDTETVAALKAMVGRSVCATMNVEENSEIAHFVRSALGSDGICHILIPQLQRIVPNSQMVTSCAGNSAKFFHAILSQMLNAQNQQGNLLELKNRLIKDLYPYYDEVLNPLIKFHDSAAHAASVQTDLSKEDKDYIAIGYRSICSDRSDFVSMLTTAIQKSNQRAINSLDKLVQIVRNSAEKTFPQTLISGALSGLLETPQVNEVLSTFVSPKMDMFLVNKIADVFFPSVEMLQMPPIERPVAPLALSSTHPLYGIAEASKLQEFIAFVSHYTRLVPHFFLMSDGGNLKYLSPDLEKRVSRISSEFLTVINDLLANRATPNGKEILQVAKSLSQIRENRLSKIAEYASRVHNKAGEAAMGSQILMARSQHELLERILAKMRG